MNSVVLQPVQFVTEEIDHDYSIFLLQNLLQSQPTQCVRLCKWRFAADVLTRIEHHIPHVSAHFLSSSKYCCSYT